jgi:hypothetical protein
VLRKSEGVLSKVERAKDEGALCKYGRELETK